MEGTVNESAEWFVSPSSSDGGILKDPQVLPRVGDQYQAEIPSLMMEYDRLQLISKPCGIEVLIDVPNHCIMGLPIPVIWIHNEVESNKDEAAEVHGDREDAVSTNRSVTSENSEECQINLKNEDTELKVEPVDTALDDEIEVGGFSNIQTEAFVEKMDIDLVLTEETAKLGHGNPVPGLLREAWREAEYDAFLLGLYIFGKNLLLVKRFVESKRMGDILSHYYGKFYRSNEYRRWSECRKMRSRRFIHGQRIFMGWRQLELLSRLFRYVSEEYRHMLTEVSKTFEEGKLSLEEYIFSLKDMVGTNMLVEAVAIGRGKQDLTGTAMEPLKSNRLIPALPEVPIGKACSSLTSGEIIKFLTGDFRLSKARSNDLFWEAAWPRLLARGWHSEQPRDLVCGALKQSLVFLMPGIKKFSRKLVKGKHFFDSVTDVLHKVASEPGLLELEIETSKISLHNEEYRPDSQMKQHPEVTSNRQHHCFLQPHNSNCNQVSMKFTIVDTSLGHGGERAKVRELRSFPINPITISIPSSLSSETESAPESSQDEAEENNIPIPIENETSSQACGNSPECVASTQNNLWPNVFNPIIETGENPENQGIAIYNDRQAGLTKNFHFSQKIKSRQSNYLAPARKQHQSTAYSHEGSSHGVQNISLDTKLNEEESNCRFMAFHDGTSQNLSSTSSLAGSLEESIEVTPNRNCLGAEPSSEEPFSQTSIDQKVPRVSQNFRTDEQFVTNMMHASIDSFANKSSFLSETSQQAETPNPSAAGANAEQQPVMSGRRQSTRNRPLTTKALEALAYGLLDTKKKRKGVDVGSQNSSMPRPSQRVRKKNETSAIMNGAM